MSESTIPLTFFRAATEHVPYGAALVGDDGAILWCNKACTDIWERPKELLYDMRWQDFTHADDIAIDERNVAQVLSGDVKHYQMPKRYIMPDGSIKWALLFVYATEDPDYPLFSTIMTATAVSDAFHDVASRTSERSHMTETLAAARRAIATARHQVSLRMKSEEKP